VKVARMRKDPQRRHRDLRSCKAGGGRGSSDGGRGKPASVYVVGYARAGKKTCGEKRNYFLAETLSNMRFP